MDTATMATTTAVVSTSAHPLVSVVSIAVVILLTELVKWLNRNRWGERLKDIVTPIVASVFVALLMGAGYIPHENIAEIVAFLVAPQGWWIVVKKLLGK
jgi:glucan phosphoethanolaminetransferase (alkaline phosphatase superfamily)